MEPPGDGGGEVCWRSHSVHQGNIVDHLWALSLPMALCPLRPGGGCAQTSRRRQLPLGVIEGHRRGGTARPLLGPEAADPTTMAAWTGPSSSFCPSGLSWRCASLWAHSCPQPWVKQSWNSGGVWGPRCSTHGGVGQFVEWGALPSLMSSLTSGVRSGIQRGAALSHPWRDGCVGWVVSHWRGTWTPGEGPEGWSPLGAKAEAAGRAADILKNVEGLPHIVVHVGTTACGKRMA